MTFGKEYEREMREDVLSSLKVLTNRDQTLNCLYFKDAEKHFQPLVDMDINLPLRIFSLWMQAVHDSSQKASNSSGSHPAVGAEDDSKSNSHADAFMKMLSETTDEHDFALGMLHPVVSRKWSNFDGPVDVTATILE